MHNLAKESERFKLQVASVSPVFASLSPAEPVKAKPTINCTRGQGSKPEGLFNLLLSHYWPTSEDSACVTLCYLDRHLLTLKKKSHSLLILCPPLSLFKLWSQSQTITGGRHC